jgi:hypothetical protein
MMGRCNDRSSHRLALVGHGSELRVGWGVCGGGIDARQDRRSAYIGSGDGESLETSSQQLRDSCCSKRATRGVAPSESGAVRSGSLPSHYCCYRLMEVLQIKPHQGTHPMKD